ncbi:hypothetical protein [Mesotoga sp. BH458_6_3_2_1]|uniref:hypothetical protein n=1 Tax=Mesotoga sp. BH458_6_3_2_1 TaxID=1437446 RepID=UPI0016004D32|nr:hypothetical protein [Mesotoga sp. BH458_6_3_2_1]
MYHLIGIVETEFTRSLNLQRRSRLVSASRLAVMNAAILEMPNRSEPNVYSVHGGEKIFRCAI